MFGRGEDCCAVTGGQRTAVPDVPSGISGASAARAGEDDSGQVPQNRKTRALKKVSFPAYYGRGGYVPARGEPAPRRKAGPDRTEGVFPKGVPTDEVTLPSRAVPRRAGRVSPGRDGPRFRPTRAGRPR